MRKANILLTGFFLFGTTSYAQAQTMNFKEAAPPLKFNCKDSKEGSICDLIEVKSGKVLASALPKERTGWGKLTSDIYQISSSCGGPCSASYFYDKKSGQFSRIFLGVQAISPDARWIIYANRTLLYSKTFAEEKDAKVINLKSPLCEGNDEEAYACIRDFKLNRDRISLTYITGKDYKEVSETLAIPELASKN